MKKFYLLILTLLLTVSFSSYTMTCYANGGSVTVNGASAKIGDEVTVKITAEDVKGVNSGSIEIKSLPEGVTVVDGSWSLSAKIAAFDPSIKRGVFALDGNKDIDGTVFKLTLKLSENAQSGDIVCEVRFKDGSEGNPDVAGIVNIPGKLTVSSESQTTDGSENANGADSTESADDNTANEGNGAGANGTDGGNEDKLSPVVIVLICAAGAALIAAVVLMITKKNK